MAPRPLSMSETIDRLDVHESMARAEVIPHARVTPEGISAMKRQLANSLQKAIVRIKEAHPYRLYRVETHHFITDWFDAVIVLTVTRQA